MLNNLKNQIKEVLIDNPASRNSDITLTIEVWRRFYWVKDSLELKRLYDLPREDDVKRIRAKFCQQGFEWAYPTDWKIAKGRKIKEDEWRVKLGYAQLPKSVYFETNQGVTKIAEDKVAEFLQLNPNAIKL